MSIDSIASWPVITLTVFTPLIGVFLLLLIPKGNETAHRTLALLISIVTFFVSLGLFTGFDASKSSFQLVERYYWLPFGMTYSVGVDGISLFLVLLTTFLTPITILSTYKAITHKVKEFQISLLLLECGMLGAFVAIDLFLFYIFWEFMLIPMYLIIGVWGGGRRIYSALKFFIFTMIGGVLMLIGLIYLYLKQGGSSMFFLDILAVALTSKEQFFLFLAFGLAFAIKVPMFPFHTWLPDAHVDAPTAGSVILAGVLLKLGTYGFLRFAIPLFPAAAGTFTIPLMLLAIIGIIYGSFMAFAQLDIKRLIAFSSVAHLGFCILGMFAFNEEALAGSILQQVNHGISTGALFLLVGIIYERRHTRLISEFGGLAVRLPVYATIFIIITLSSIGLPGTNGFIGEFLILAGTFREALTADTATSYGYLVFVFGVLAATGIILSAVYMLTMVRRMFFGQIVNPKNETLSDLSLREFFVLMPLVIVVFVIGFFPNIFLKRMEGSVNLTMKLYREKIAAIRSPGITKKLTSDNKISEVLKIK